MKKINEIKKQITKIIKTCLLKIKIIKFNILGPFAQFIAICALSVSVHTLTVIGFERYLLESNTLIYVWFTNINHKIILSIRNKS